MNTTERPLGDVLARNSGGFVPARPCRAPWQHEHLDHVQVAATGVAAVAPLDLADRTTLRDLDRAPRWRDELEPTDWMAVGWAIAEP